MCGVRVLVGHPGLPGSILGRGKMFSFALKRLGRSPLISGAEVKNTWRLVKKISSCVSLLCRTVPGCLYLRSGLIVQYQNQRNETGCECMSRFCVAQDRDQ
jgi:hypothetical protein